MAVSCRCLSSSSRRPHPIPWYFRLPITVVEPFMAFSAAAMLHFQPAAFLEAMSPRHFSFSSLAQVRTLTDQLASMELLFAFNQAVVLGATRDLRTWKLLSLGMLMSDVLHIGASLRELSSLGATWSTLRASDIFNFVVLGSVGAIRLCICLGIAVRKEDEQRDSDAVQHNVDDHERRPFLSVEKH